MNTKDIYRVLLTIFYCGGFFIAAQGVFGAEKNESTKSVQKTSAASRPLRNEALPSAPTPSPLIATPAPLLHENRYSPLPEKYVPYGPTVDQTHYHGTTRTVVGQHQTHQHPTHQHSGYQQAQCPLCKNNPQTPCGECKMCLAGFPCEYALCRHCVLMRSKNMGNSCDLAAGGVPCGTCDLCREHRSDPCEHADDGYERSGAYNPNQERTLGAVLPRPLVDVFNNGARKFPVYYNPAPYVRSNTNPSLFAGYQRPYTHRWSCPLCYKDPCQCTQPGFAGQVPYAYSCRFCNRHPCACAAEICNVNKEMDPKGVANTLTRAKAIDANTSEGEALRKKMQQPTTPGTPAPIPSNAKPTTSPNQPSWIGDVFDDITPPGPGTSGSILEKFENDEDEPRAPLRTPTRPQLDRPAPTDSEKRGAVAPMI